MILTKGPFIVETKHPLPRVRGIKKRQVIRITRRKLERPSRNEISKIYLDLLDFYEERYLSPRARSATAARIACSRAGRIYDSRAIGIQNNR